VSIKLDIKLVVGWQSGYPSRKLEFDAILCVSKIVIRYGRTAFLARV